MTFEEFINDPDVIEWYKETPEVIKEAIKRMPPIHKYRFKDGKKECYITGYTEPKGEDQSVGSVTLIVKIPGVYMDDLEIIKEEET